MPNQDYRQGRPFIVSPGSDGVDDTFDVWHRSTGCVVAAFHYWEERAWALRRARQLAAALNALHRDGYVHRHGFNEAINQLDADTQQYFGEECTTSSDDAESRS